MDTGPGVAAGEMEVIFHPFGQTAAGARAGGTGLGLAISRELARLMGGDITLASTVGQGSCFRLELPVAAGQNDISAPAVAAAGPVAVPPPTRAGQARTGRKPMQLPAATVEDLRRAAAGADYERIIGILDALARTSPAAAGALREIVDQFDYPELLARIEREAG
jgi:hypothetical protein